jgi:pantothenate kinase
MGCDEYILEDAIFEVSSRQCQWCQNVFPAYINHFLSGHPVTMNTLSYAINFWSKGEMKALFLRHEGHLGATGAVRRMIFDEHAMLLFGTNIDLLNGLF